MMISRLNLFLWVLFPGILLAETEWKPSFDDKPVTSKELSAIKEALPDKPIAKPQAERRVLIVSSTAGFRHGSIPVGLAALEELGKATGAYEAIISDDPANFEPEALKEFDAVILLNTTNNFFMPNKKQREEFSDEEWKALRDRHNRLIDNLIDYVEEGGGLIGIHAATDCCYGHKRYGETMGAYFAGHPWGAHHQVTIVVEDPTHAIMEPVFKGMDDFTIKEEIYQFSDKPYSRERLRILLHLDPERSDEVEEEKIRRKDNDFAVCWVQGVGKGRVFYTSIGHRKDIYWNPLMLKHYLAGIQFAAGDIEADTTPSAKIQMPNLKN